MGTREEWWNTWERKWKAELKAASLVEDETSDDSGGETNENKIQRYTCIKMP